MAKSWHQSLSRSTSLEAFSILVMKLKTYDTSGLRRLIKSSSISCYKLNLEILAAGSGFHPRTNVFNRFDFLGGRDIYRSIPDESHEKNHIAQQWSRRMSRRENKFKIFFIFTLPSRARPQDAWIFRQQFCLMTSICTVATSELFFQFQL